VFTERIIGFMMKSLKEAKVNTSWINPNKAYEDAVAAFVQSILDPADSAAFLDDFSVLQQRVAFLGMFNSLSQTLLKLGSPGVSDIYQGNELWDLSLVDPDNRRPVDYARRQADLAGLCSSADPADLLGTAEDGRIKLYVTWRLLQLRRSLPGLFVGGGYSPLRAVGRARTPRHVCAFARTDAGQTLIVAAPVLIPTLLRDLPQQPPIGPTVWRDDWLPVPAETAYRDLFTGRLLEPRSIEGRPALLLRDVFGSFPVAALLAESA
jgi:(1->4)-alpha-D-glucan 1-alpha-D-glucosylmutase